MATQTRHSMMQAVVISQYGSNDVLRHSELPSPVPKKGQVLVRVRASVNPRDWIVRDGRYICKLELPGFPIILGSDISGEVVACGPKAAHRLGSHPYRPDRTWGQSDGLCGASGGVVSYAVQFAKVLGAHVTAVTRRRQRRAGIGS